MKRTQYYLLCVFSLLSLACEREKIPGSEADNKSIVILSDNDVHCAIDGYARLAGLHDAIAASDTAWVATVSCGDYLQGGNAGALSRGQYIVDVMKAVGFDAVTLGNHEFDYGMDRMQELVPQIGLFNGGGFRNGISAGTITYGDVAVLDEDSGKWIPLDPDGRYTIASSDYYARGGFYDTLKDCKQLFYSTGLVRDALADYLETTLGGTVPAIYAEPQGRITIIDD